jgi:VCBS repeat-containing protein
MTTYEPLDISNLVNADLTLYSGGSNYPQNGGLVTVAGVTFQLATGPNNDTSVVQGSWDGSVGDIAIPRDSQTFLISPNLFGVTTVYTLINSAFGTAGTNIGSLVFYAQSGATFTYNLIEGFNVRDHYQDGFVNSATDLAGTIDFGPLDRFDMQKILLPAAFASDTLVRIDFNTFGQGVNGVPFLTAIDVVATAQPPIASNISASANEDTNIIPVALSASFIDLDATDTFTFATDATATIGKVANNNDGTFTYDPNGKFEYLSLGETATDSFTYTVSDNHGASSTATATVVIHGEDDAPRITNKIFGVDHLTDEQIAVEMVKLAIDAYPPLPQGAILHLATPLATRLDNLQEKITARMDVQADGWHAVSAGELGLSQLGPQGSFQYSFLNGYYQAVNYADVLNSDPSEADALVLTGYVNGKFTLAISFAGTDQVSDIRDYANFGDHYKKFAPLVAAIKDYIDQNNVEQVFISGHSLGAAMAQYFIEDPTFQNDPHFQAHAWTIGSPGADNSSFPDPRITNFVHELDPVTQVPFITSLPLEDKIEIGLPTLIPFFLKEGVGAADASALALAAITDQKVRQGETIYLGSDSADHNPDSYLIDLKALYGDPLHGLPMTATSLKSCPQRQEAE